MSRRFDAVIIGSGINSLVAGALLARAGWSACILERNNWLGGAIRTAEITEPGFAHEVFSSWHPMFVSGGAYTELKADLEARGLEYLNTEFPTATLFPDGESLFLTTSREQNVAVLGEPWARAAEEFLASADISFGVLSTELWSRAGLGLGWKAYRRFGRRGTVEFLGNVLVSARDWLETTFDSERAHGLLAPWVLHVGLGPESAMSGFMTQVIAVATELVGMPVPRGGGVRLVEALAGIVRDGGGVLETERDVAQVTVSPGGSAAGVRTADGEEIHANRAVLASVTPDQLYGRLLRDGPIEEAGRFRYGRGEMQIHMALSEPPQWVGDERLADTAVVHVTPGLDGVSRAVNEADRGLLPAEATIACGQPVALDASRAPSGASILWLQLPEVPSRVKGDAAGELDVGDGTWTPELREAYADRIQSRLSGHITNLDSALLRRVVLSPADIEEANVNMRGGDIYSGSTALDQNLLWRPRPGLPGHRTHVAGLWHIGASTHPGPGLGGGSGYLVAKRLLDGGRRRARTGR